MKKLLLLAVLGLTFLSTVNAQDRPPIVTYEVSSNSGYCNGLNLPNPFYIHVDKLSTNVFNEVPYNGLSLYSYTYTSMDSSDYNTKLVNDSIPELKTFFMTIPEVDTLTLDGMIEKFVKEDLKAKFGAGNVVKIE